MCLCDQALSGLARCLELQPEEYEPVEVKTDDEDTEGSTVQKMDTNTTDESQTTSANEPSSPIPSKPNKRKLTLDRAHLDASSSGADGASSRGGSVRQSPSCRKRELAAVLKKLSAIKEVARRKVEKGGEEHPWLAENVTVAACLCAKSVRSNEEEGACNKRQKTS